MKTFDEFITEARRASRTKKLIRGLARQSKKLQPALKAVSSSKPAKRAKRFVGATAIGMAVKLLTGL
jgi:hypothetical protein